MSRVVKLSYEEPDVFEGTCEACQGTGQEYEGDVVVGDCPHCAGSGFNDS